MPAPQSASPSSGPGDSQESTTQESIEEILRVAPWPFYQRRLIELFLGLLKPSTPQQDNPERSDTMITSEVGDNNENCGNIDGDLVEHHGFRSRLNLIMSTFVGHRNRNSGNINSSTLSTLTQTDTRTESEHTQEPRSFLSELYLIIRTLVGNGNDDSGNITHCSTPGAVPVNPEGLHTGRD